MLEVPDFPTLREAISGGFFEHPDYLWLSVISDSIRYLCFARRAALALGAEGFTLQPQSASNAVCQ
jgi:hypothetical protein